MEEPAAGWRLKEGEEEHLSREEGVAPRHQEEEEQAAAAVAGRTLVAVRGYAALNQEKMIKGNDGSVSKIVRSSNDVRNEDEADTYVVRLRIVLLVLGMLLVLLLMLLVVLRRLVPVGLLLDGGVPRLGPLRPDDKQEIVGKELGTLNHALIWTTTKT